MQSGHIASGAVNGFFGPTRNINSGTVGVFDLGSGAVIAGTVGSGAVVSANLASGQVSQFKLASGAVNSGHVGSGAVVFDSIASGQVQTTSIGSGAVVSGRIGSAQVGQFHIASGAVTSGRLGVTETPDGTKFLRDDFTWQTAGGGLTSGAVQSGHIGSGSVDGFFGVSRRIQSGTVGGSDFGSGAVVAGAVGSGAIVSANLASGQIGLNHLASTVDIATYLQTNAVVVSGSVASGAAITYARQLIVDNLVTAELISGLKAVCYASGGTAIVRATWGSGLRLPAIGVTYSGAASGTVASVVRYGPVFVTTSGQIASGNHGRYLYTGSGGHIVNLSGFMAGAASGPGPGQLSGTAVQVLGLAISGGIFVNPAPDVRSGLITIAGAVN